MPEKIYSGIGISSGSQLPQSGISIPSFRRKSCVPLRHWQNSYQVDHYLKDSPLES